jgi:hypothetical protein
VRVLNESPECKQALLDAGLVTLLLAFLSDELSETLDGSSDDSTQDQTSSITLSDLLQDWEKGAEMIEDRRINIFEFTGVSELRPGPLREALMIVSAEGLDQSAQPVSPSG